jgi:DNA-directed RNA polymerase specialized sigma subunit
VQDEITINMLDEIPCRPFSGSDEDQARLRRCVSLMQSNNPSLRAAAEMLCGPRHVKNLRNAIITLAEKQFPRNALERQALLDAEEFVKELKQGSNRWLYEEAKEAVLNVRRIEMEMVEGYVRMMQKLSKQWSSSNYNTLLDYEDFCSLAWEALVDAIYGYTEGASFRTYAHQAICNKFSAAVLDASPRCYFSADERKLFQQFDRYRAEAGERTTLADFVQAADLPEETARNLSLMLVKVTNLSQLNAKTGDHCEEGFEDEDITSYRKDASLAVSGTPEVQDSPDFENNLDRAHLNERERDALVSSFHPYYGWETDVAKRHVNPQTGKCYSRMATSLWLEAAYKKMSRIYRQYAEQLEEVA